MKRSLFIVMILAVIIGADSVLADWPPFQTQWPTHETGTMGGVPNPSVAVLQAIDDANYILHAKDGVLSQITVNKVLLDNDPSTNPQAISAI